METIVYKNLTQEDIEKIAKKIKNGAIISFPTETVYGIGCDIYNKEATNEIFKLKKREASKALIVHVSNLNQANQIAYLTDDFYILANKYFPGPLTLIVQKREEIDILSNNNTIAIRMPNNKKTLKVIDKSGPIFGTSANISNNKSPINSSEVFSVFNSKLPIIIDDGLCLDKKPSTILDLTSNPYKILREGSISKNELAKILNKEIL
jgi:L-threonylcarbamoyladenylate synthase